MAVFVDIDDAADGRDRFVSQKLKEDGFSPVVVDRDKEEDGVGSNHG